MEEEKIAYRKITAQTSEKIWAGRGADYTHERVVVDENTRDQLLDSILSDQYAFGTFSKRDQGSWALSQGSFLER